MPDPRHFAHPVDSGDATSPRIADRGASPQLPAHDAHGASLGSQRSNSDAASRRPKRSSSGSRATDPSNLEDFVAYAYAKKGKRVACKKKTATALAEAPLPSDEFWSRLAALAKDDVLLAVPRQILLAALQHRGNSRAWMLFHRVCTVAFQSHPAMSRAFSEITASDMTLENVEGILQRAADANYSASSPPDSSTPLTKAQASTLRFNVVYSLALWAFAVRRLNGAALIRMLCDCLWEGEARRLRSEADKWRRVVESKDPACCGIAAMSFAAEIDELRSDATQARQDANDALRRAEQAEQEVAALTRALAQERQSVADVSEQLRLQQKAHEAKVSHLHDDYERLRTRVLRRLKRELDLLDEGMLALNRQPPKVHVMQDHGDRVIGGIREEIAALQSEGKA